MKKLIIVLLITSFVITACTKEEKPKEYLEISYNSRIYVVGSPKMLAKYSQENSQNQVHLPYTQTYIGLGPKGETVVFENAKKSSALKVRLLSRFCLKHNSAAPACK